MRNNKTNGPAGEQKIGNSKQELFTASIEREIHFFGAMYGVMAGLALATAQWGWDAIQLSQSHAFFPWLKLILGMLVCGLIGGATGWLVSRKERGCLSFLFWLIASFLFAWAAISIPLQIVPAVSKVLEPQLGSFVNYEIGSTFIVRFWIAVMWIVIFSFIVGVLQSTLIESAVASASSFGRVAPFLICMVLMGISGFVIDDLINVPFRGAIFSVETPIEFILGHRGQDIDPKESREAHAGALGSVEGNVTASRKLIVSGYDEDFWRIDVLVSFDNAWVNCITFNNQASYCKFAESLP